MFKLRGRGKDAASSLRVNRCVSIDTRRFVKYDGDGFLVKKNGDGFLVKNNIRDVHAIVLVYRELLPHHRDRAALDHVQKVIFLDRSVCNEVRVMSITRSSGETWSA